MTAIELLPPQERVERVLGSELWGPTPSRPSSQFSAQVSGLLTSIRIKVAEITVASPKLATRTPRADRPFLDINTSPAACVERSANGTKWTFRLTGPMSAYDPKRTSRLGSCCEKPTRHLVVGSVQVRLSHGPQSPRTENSANPFRLPSPLPSLPQGASPVSAW